VPFTDLIGELFELVAEDAAALGCEAKVQHVRKIAAEGTSADRQVACYERLISQGAQAEEAVKGVVDMLIAETVAGT
jgi:carboxylate-amine ligase